MHHRLIQSLVNEIRLLRQQVENMSESHIRFEERMEERNQRLRDNNERLERQRNNEKEEEQSRQWQREDLMNKLERQERMGNDYGANKTRRELKNFL